MPPELIKVKHISSFSGKYSFLSNFFLSPISYGDHPNQEKGAYVIYPTAEHLFQAFKTKNENVRIDISNAATPQLAKSMGRGVRLREDWEQVKNGVMYVVIMRKFLQNLRLAKLLCKTGEAKLIEENRWHDNYWGDCLCLRCHKTDGRNQLGITLMKIRTLCHQNA